MAVEKGLRERIVKTKIRLHIRREMSMVKGMKKKIEEKNGMKRKK